MDSRKEKYKGRIQLFILLHVLFFVYSISGVFSKLAGRSVFLSYQFFVFYGFVLLGLLIYAILWQQILKKIPLVTAYANKAVTVVWGVVWGRIIFDEAITIQKMTGVAVIVVGILVIVNSDSE